MNRSILKFISALLIAVLLTTSFALAEDTVAQETTPEEEVILEAVDEDVASEEIDFFQEDEEVPEEIEVDMFEAQAEDPVDEVTNEAADAALYAPEGSIHIDQAHFPDSVFRNYILNLSIDNDQSKVGDDEYLSPQEIELINMVDVSFENVASLEGVQLLKNLEYLFCQETNITTLDLSGLPNLFYVSCDFCQQLTSLTLGTQNNLYGLGIIECKKLASVDISQCYTLMSNIDRGERIKVRNESWHNIAVTFNRWGYIDGNQAYCIEFSDCTEVILYPGIPIQTVPDEIPEVITPAPSTPSTPVTPTIPATKKKNKAKVSGKKGDTFQLDLGGKTGKKYKSSNKKVATVDQTGKITVKKAGKTTISWKQGKKTRKVVLTITDPTIPLWVVTNIMGGGHTAQVGTTTTVVPAVNDGAVTGYKWTTSNKKVASVKNGTITFKKAGKVTITCTTTRGNKKAKVIFKVSK